ncbi:hypothetical protein D0T49_04385 [Paludibacter sp. 221]|uniref:phosphoadenosine phosphosulfate reductase domain-containing protein n=1 Tax=Paludibacter sp. 221 TaxID=2302939 RepID=UPI0013D2DE55|nr:phosphoadenosine phosphosulfate reductase family protein [Paludibacter sp. 221]NDV46276.1 hypothetical protein [Paludibacter sp. 221]
MDKEYTTLKFIQKIAKSIPDLYAGNSGGKDSAVLDFLLQKSEIKYKSYYCNTTIDPHGTVSHIMKNYPHTDILQPKNKETFFKLVERKGLPTRLNRYCCQYLKEFGSVGKSVFEGVRAEESTKRQGRDYIQCDTRKWQKKAKHIYPLYDWTEKEIYNYIEKYDIKLAPCYSNGFSRLGCVGCPQVTRKGVRMKEFESHPKYLESIKRAIKKGMENNPQWKITQLADYNEDVAIAWWLSGKTMNEYFQPNQLKLFI